MMWSQTAIPGSAVVISKMGFDRMDRASFNAVLRKSCCICHQRKGQ